MTSKEDVFDCCKAILKDLQMDYLDLFLVSFRFISTLN